MVERRRAWHAFIAFGQPRRSDGVGRCMPSSPLACIHDRQCRAWHDITALGQHTRSVMSSVTLHHRPWTANTVDNVGHGVTLPPFHCTHGRQRRAWHAIIAFGLADAVGRRRAWHATSPLDGKHGRTTSSVACLHCLWAAQMVGWRRALHAIIAFGLHTRSTMSGVA